VPAPVLPLHVPPKLHTWPNPQDVQAAPFAPHAEFWLPSWHLFMLSQQPGQVDELHRADGEHASKDEAMAPSRQPVRIQRIIEEDM
jgi:hypothetical protein